MFGLFHCNRRRRPPHDRAGIRPHRQHLVGAGKEGNPNASAYSASKAAVIALTKSLGKELAGHDIAVNAVTPAAAKTEMFLELTPEFRQYMTSKIPRGRLLEISELVSLVTWLATEENSFSTGAVFDISGGRSVY